MGSWKMVEIPTRGEIWQGGWVKGERCVCFTAQVGCRGAKEGRRENVAVSKDPSGHGYKGRWQQGGMWMIREEDLGQRLSRNW